MNAMNNDQTLPDILHGILDCLKRQEASKERSREDLKSNRRRDSFAQICSMYAIIAIFIATLGVGFLTYTHDTFSDRPADAPGKATDHVVTIFLLLSVLFSISSSIALGAGASPTLLLSLPSQDAIHELLVFLIATGVPRPLAYSIQRFYRSKRQPQECLSQSGPTTPQASTFSNAGRIRLHTPWDRVRTKFALQPRTIINFWASLNRVKKLTGTEFQFVIAMLLVALLCILLSLVCLAVAVITFSWAELGKPVAIVVTVSLIFPFAVVGCVAIVYRCTLFRWFREGKGHLGGDKQEEMSLEQLRGENTV